jgi:hypothetical protein
MRLIQASVAFVAAHGALGATVPAQKEVALGEQLLQTLIDAPHFLLPNSK